MNKTRFEYFVDHIFHPLEYDDDQARWYLINFMQRELLTKSVKILSDGNEHTVKIVQEWVKIPILVGIKYEEYNKLIMSIIIDGGG